MFGTISFGRIDTRRALSVRMSNGFWGLTVNTLERTQRQPGTYRYPISVFSASVNIFFTRHDQRLQVLVYPCFRGEKFTYPLESRRFRQFCTLSAAGACEMSPRSIGASAAEPAAEAAHIIATPSHPPPSHLATTSKRFQEEDI